MAKTKTNIASTEAEPSNSAADPTLVDHRPAPATARFKRKAAVTVPTLQMEESKPVFVKILEAIRDEPKETKDKQTGQKVAVLDPESGQPSFLGVTRVVDLKTGEIMQMVIGAALRGELEKYQGGNKKYVGLCYEITKMPAKPGKRAKQYTVFEVDAPGEGAV